MLAAGFTALGRDSGGVSMTISSGDRKYFEEMGELYVRRAMQMTDRFPFPFENLAREWLAERNEAQRPMREARQAKMAKQSERTLRAAWITALVAIGAIAVAVLAWIFPLH
jgi:hypothetical protein